MKSIYWLDRLIEEKKLPSDRQAGLMLGLTRGAMSMHRTGKATTLDDSAAYKLEELLNLPHGKVVADQHAEREKDPAIASMWRKLASSAASLLLALAFFGLSIAPNPADASINSYKSSNYVTIHYAQLRRRWRKALLKLINYTPDSRVWSCNRWILRLN